MREATSRLADSFGRSQSIYGAKAKAIAEVIELADDCAEEGWDGYGAAPVSTSALNLTIDIIHALPFGIPMPEAVPEPDGAISLDWEASRYRRFSLSAGTTNRLAYAWLDGADKGHGVARFDGNVIPAMVLRGILEVVENGNARVRAA